MAAQTFLDCGMVDLMTGRTALVVGVKDDPDGALKVYVGARYRGIYVLVDDANAQHEIQRAWATGGHVLVPLPDDSQLHRDGDQT